MALEHLPVTIRLNYFGVGRWVGFAALPTNLLEAPPSGLSRETIQVHLEGSAGSRTATIHIGSTAAEGDDFAPDIEASAQITLTASDGTVLYRGGFAGDTADPYTLPISDPNYDTVHALRNGSYINLTLEVAAVNADPGTVSTAAPAASLSAEGTESAVDADPGTVAADTPSASLSAEAVAGEVNADPGTVAAAAPSASLSAETASDPVNADPGAVSTAAPSASLSAEAPDPIDVEFGTVATAAPSASLRAGRRTAVVNADPGTVASGSPTASLAVEGLDAAVDVQPGTVSGGTPTASLQAVVTGFNVDAVLGTVSAGAPNASLRVAAGSISEDFATDERAATPRQRILTCAEFRHPDLAAPLRAVNDTEDRVVAGETYRATRFEAKLADDAKRRAPRAEISVGNVGRALSTFVEESGGGAGGTVRLFQVLDVAGASPEWELTLDVMGITGDSANVRISLGFDPLLGRPAVALRYDPQTAPGLF